jgi:RNA recognition motif-containing protein
MGINLQGNILYIKRSTGLLPIYSASSSLGLISASNNSNIDNPEDCIKLRECTPSKVIMIKNMCTMKELEDDNEYEDLYDDVLEECKNYGKVIQVKIPRMDGTHNMQGLGKVFVEYYTRDGATFAREHLHDKCFHGRFVEVVFHPEDMFRKNQLD